MYYIGQKIQAVGVLTRTKLQNEETKTENNNNGKYP